MKALIIYDDFAGAARASAALQRATWIANFNADWDIRPWRTDVLRVASAADEALIEAADADLIVFAGFAAYSLPTWLTEWLKRWVMRREIEDVALAMIRGMDAGTLAVPVVAQLSRFAVRHGLSFILGKEAEPKNQPLSIPHAVRVCKSTLRECTAYSNPKPVTSVK
jgi:hypothetical protein